MKRTIVVFLCLCFLFGLSACGGSGEEENMTTGMPSAISENGSTNVPVQRTDVQSTADEDNTGAQGGTLVVYFSATGNTRTVAETLAAQLGAEIYEIVPEQPYSDEDLNYSNSNSRATAEQNDENARPAIAGALPDLTAYDTVYIGFPIWWGNMPRILYTFFDACDFSGKTIAPFCTSGSSGIAAASRTLAELEPNAVVTEGLQIGASALDNAQSALADWVASLHLPE